MSKKMTILFLAKEAGLSYINWLRFYLEDIGHQIVYVTTVNECIAEYEKSKPDILFSVNFQFILAEIAKRDKLPYVFWGVDAVVNRLLFSKHFVSDYTFVFECCQEDYDKFRKAGYKNVFLLPLAVDEKSLVMNKPATKNYQSNIAFVGGNYAPRNEYHNLLDALYKYYPNSREIIDNNLISFFDEIFEKQNQDICHYIVPKLLLEDDKYGLNIEDLAPLYENEIINVIADGQPKDKRFLSEMIADTLSHESDRRFREAIIRRLAPYGFSLWGDEGVWQNLTCTDNLTFHGYCQWGEQMSDVYKGAKIGLTMTRLFIDAVSMRIFEIAASKTLCLVKFTSELPQYFDIGKEVVAFESIEEAEILADYYLRHDTERERIGQAGHERMLRDHTLRKRLDSMSLVLQEAGVF